MVKTMDEVFADHLKNFSKDVTQMVIDMFTENKGIDPIVFGLVIKDQKLAIAVLDGLGRLFISDETKDVAAQMIKQISDELKMVAVAFVSEGWSGDPKKKYESLVDKDGNYREGIVRPSDDPNREEILFFCFETHNKQAAKTFKIIRIGEEVTLTGIDDVGDIWADKKPDGPAGRFNNLLSKDHRELTQLLKTQINNLN